jgi:hypothetical protein
MKCSSKSLQRVVRASRILPVKICKGQTGLSLMTKLESSKREVKLFDIISGFFRKPNSEQEVYG